MPRHQRHARPRSTPAARALPAKAPPLRLADRTTMPPAAAPLHARALQQRLVHRFERGDPELPPVRRYPPAVRLLLLLGATGASWWSLYVLSRLALG